MELLMSDREKKLRERRLIEEARRRSTCFPAGELSVYEKPDWLIRSASLGIEVTELLPAKAGDALFSRPQLSCFQEEVVRTAEQRITQRLAHVRQVCWCISETTGTGN